MRPRVFPAEDSGSVSTSKRARSSFNEAAGIPRGRLGDMLEVLEELGLASMRPRVFPAEDSPPCSSCPKALTRFNEAAGIPRGRRNLRWLCLRCHKQLQ